MARYRVILEASAELIVDVEVSDDLEPWEAEEKAVELAYREADDAYLCAQCSGHGRRWRQAIQDYEQATYNGEIIEPERID